MTCDRLIIIRIKFDIKILRYYSDYDENIAVVAKAQTREYQGYIENLLKPLSRAIDRSYTSVDKSAFLFSIIIFLFVLLGNEKRKKNVAVLFNKTSARHSSL